MIKRFSITSKGFSLTGMSRIRENTTCCMPGGWNYFNTLLFDQNYNNPVMIERSLNRNLVFKGLLLNATKDIISSLKEINDPEVNKLIDNFKNAKATLTKQLSLPVKDRTMDIEFLNELSSNYETELVKQYNARFEEKLDFDRDWTQIRDRLNPGEVALEFVSYNEVKNRFYSGVENYFAYLISPDLELPVRIELFGAEELKALLKSKSINQIYTSRGSKGRSTLDSPSLYNLIWKPLQEHLGGVNKIYFSPSGILNQIPFVALQDAEG